MSSSCVRPEDDSEVVVEVVRHARGQLAERAKLLAAEEPVLKIADRGHVREEKHRRGRVLEDERHDLDLGEDLPSRGVDHLGLEGRAVARGRVERLANRPCDSGTKSCIGSKSARTISGAERPVIGSSVGSRRPPCRTVR